MRYFLSLSYLGTRYNGWQKQPGANTVQGVLDQQIEKLLNASIHSLASGRTDAGVHAQNMLIQFDTEAEIPAHFIKRINLLLPEDIVAHQLYVSEREDLNVRFHSLWRQYEYKIHFYKDPFRFQTSYCLQRESNPEILEQCAHLLMGKHDFYRFQKTGGSIKTSVCNIIHSQWEFKTDQWSFHIQADRFLRGMVRLLVGSMLDTARGKISIAEFEDRVYNASGRKSASSAPAHGLCFKGCSMPEGSLIPWKLQ